MEPEVHLIDKYFQIIKKCLTMTNIQLKGGKEIDLLAIDPRTQEKFHIESRVTISSFKIRLHDTHTKSGKAHRRGLDYFAKKKFDHSTIVKNVQKIFGSTEYRKILVVWDVQERSVVEQAKEMYGIEIWFFKDLLKALVTFSKIKGAKGSRDDVMRLVEIFGLMSE